MKTFFQFSILLIFASIFASCSSKPVTTEYFQEKDITKFTARVLKTNQKGKEIEIIAEKECAGKVICKEKEIRMTVKHADRFSFLKGKNLDIKIENNKFDLNQRDYSNSYKTHAIAKDGTSGLMAEQFLIWMQESDFKEIAHAQDAVMNIGDYPFPLSVGQRDTWQILLDDKRLLEIMDDEQKREYGQFPHEKQEVKEQDIRKERMVSEAEESTWQLVKDSKSIEDMEYFLEQFPASPYAIPAKLKLKQLKRE